MDGFTVNPGGFSESAHDAVAQRDLLKAQVTWKTAGIWVSVTNRRNAESCLAPYL
jgi:hypothetical protein